MVDYRAFFKKRRQEKGLTQTQLGEMVDRTQAYIYEIESGRKPLPLICFFKSVKHLTSRCFRTNSKKRYGDPIAFFDI